MNGFHDFEAFLGMKLYFTEYKHCVQKKDNFSDLKGLSIEMDLAISSVVRHVFIKECNEEIFRKFRPSLYCRWESIKDIAPPRTMLAIIGTQLPTADKKLTAPYGK